MTIIYIHDFRCDEKNKNRKILEEIFPEFNIVTASFKPDAEKQIEKIFKCVECYPVLFVGTSLGALYAMHSGVKYNCKALAIYPSLNPYDTILEGKYKTHNFDLNYIVDDTVITEWVEISDIVKKYQIESEFFHKSLIHIVNNEDDEVLDFSGAQNISAFFTSYQKGSHRSINFKMMILDYIEMIKNLKS